MSANTVAVTLSWYPVFAIWKLQKAGYQAFLVGGAVRDMLLGLPTTDYDITTNATPQQIQELFPNSVYENEFGTVNAPMIHLAEQLNQEWHIAVEHLPIPPLPQVKKNDDRLIDVAHASKLHASLLPKQIMNDNEANADTKQQLLFPEHLLKSFQKAKGVEITTYRTDGEYLDFRRPSEVTWGNSLAEDLERRDFTINALAIELNESATSTCPTELANNPSTNFVTFGHDEYILNDFHKGKEHLLAGLIVTVGKADTRFKEDALRMLRAIRFSVQLNFQIDEHTFSSIQKHAALLEHVSGERIRDELMKMLASPYPAEAIELLDQTHLLEYVLPELLSAKGVEQSGHHTTDVWTHSLDALRTCPSPDPLVRLATLLHDVGKPNTFRKTQAGITFYNHEMVGAKMVKVIGDRLRLSKAETRKLVTLVRHHMFYYQPHNTDAAIRRFMRKVGLENIDDILDLREGDRLGSGARKTSWRLEEMKQRMLEQLHQPLDVTDLAINGHDLLKHFPTLKPGPLMGKVLNELFEKVMDNAELNTKEELLNIAGKLIDELA
jgi:putative nucleotidyltransferase with HDIG domain